MKRVLVLNGDSYVGERVVQRFYAAREYEVEITRSASEGTEAVPLAFRSRSPPLSPAFTAVPASTVAASGPDPVSKSLSSRLPAGTATSAAERLRASQKPLSVSSRAGTDAAASQCPTLRPHRTAPPRYFVPFVTAVIPSYAAQPQEFCACVLENDIIVAIVDEDATEAECAIKVLMNSHYEVEKTFVLVSSALTWADTLVAERAAALQARRKQRDDARRAHWEEMLADAEADSAGADDDEEVLRLRKRLAEPELFTRDEELPPELREPVEEVAGDELVPPRELTEEAYTSRVPHPRFQHAKVVEHAVKRANSATLHTHVLFAGLPYGAGEGPLYSYFLSAFEQRTQPHGSLAASLLADNPTVGEHVLPMIHVEDLAALTFKVGSAYEVSQDRYMFAVDRGNLTVRRILQAIDARLGAGNVNHGGASSSPASEEMMVKYTDASLPPPKSMEELRAMHEDDTTHPLFGGGGGVRRCFLLSDIRAEPAAAFSFLPEENWVAVDGFADVMDKLVFQFKKARDLQPRRVLVTGPPLSGAETVAACLAARYDVPLLTIEAVTAAFEAHVAAMRQELVELLATRMQRRWDRSHMRRVKEVMAERAEAAARAADEKAEKARLRKEARDARRAAGEDVDSNDEDEEDEEDEEDGEEGPVDDGSSLSARGGGGAASERSLVFSEDKRHTQRHVVARMTERYIQGYTEDATEGDVELGPEDDEEEEDEQLFAQAEEDLAQEEAEAEENGDAGATRGHARALAAIRAADLREKIRIRQLRLAYRLAQKALSMRLTNGCLLLPRKPGEEEEDEEEESDDEAGGDGNTKKRKGSWGGGSDGDVDDADELVGGDGDDESDGEDDGEGSVGGGGGGSDGESGDDAVPGADDSSAAASSVFSVGRRNREIAANAHQRKTRKGKVLPTESVVEYLDEAKAFLVRWRLRQPDCRNQGYVLCDFPATVRQACLLFYANPPSDGGEGGEEEGEGDGEADSGHPLVPPAAVEEVPPPVDHDFPFASLDTFSEEQLRELEEDIRADRLHIVDPKEEGVLAAVWEGSFPDHVIVLDDKDETLQALAAAVAGAKAARSVRHESPSPPSHSGLGTPALPDTTAQPRVPQEKKKVEEGAAAAAANGAKESDAVGAAASAAAAQLRVDEEESGAITTASSSAPQPTSFTAPEASEAASQDRLTLVNALVDKLLVTGDNFYKQLSYYRKHHKLPGASMASAAVAAPPTESLVTWLQSVQTRQIVGATADPILVHAVKKQVTGADGGTENDEDGETEGEGEVGGALPSRFRVPPSTARTAQVDMLPSPPRNADTMRTELLDVLSHSTPVVLHRESIRRSRSHDGGGADVALPLKVVAAAHHHPSLAASESASTNSKRAKTTSSGFSQTEQPLQWLADKLTRSILPPPAHPMNGRSETALPSLPPAPLPLAARHTVTPPAEDPTTAAVAAEKEKEKEAEEEEERRGAEENASPASSTLLEPIPQRSVRFQGGDSGASAQDEAWESARLADLQQSECVFRKEMERREEAGLRLERAALRHAQLKEQCLGVWSAAQMPKESYLMKYVIPHVTAAMQEVARLRPEDPVTVLADLLYKCADQKE